MYKQNSCKLKPKNVLHQRQTILIQINFFETNGFFSWNVLTSNYINYCLMENNFFNFRCVNNNNNKNNNNTNYNYYFYFYLSSFNLTTDSNSQFLSVHFKHWVYCSTYLCLKTTLLLLFRQWQQFAKPRKE